MAQNDYHMDSRKKEEKQFPPRIKVLVFCAIFLTGIFLISRACLLGLIVAKGRAGEIEMMDGAWQLLLTASMLCCFLSLIKIARDKKPFSNILAYCLWVVGVLFTVAAVIFPRLSGYQTSGFEIFSQGSFVLMDGAILLPGLLFILFGSLIKAGFQMQKEIDEIL